MRSSLRASVILFLALNVLAHSHNDTLTEEEATAPVDNILWIHILLQSLVWGVIFPIGMVLGLSRSRWHVPLQVIFHFALTHLPGRHYMLTKRNSVPLLGYWLCSNGWRLYPGALAQRTLVSLRNSWQICEYTHHSYPWPTSHWHLPETSYQREIVAAICRHTARNYWEGLPYIWMGSDVVWNHLVSRILSWGSSW